MRFLVSFSFAISYIVNPFVFFSTVVVIYAAFVGTYHASRDIILARVGVKERLEIVRKESSIVSSFNENGARVNRCLRKTDYSRRCIPYQPVEAMML